MVFVDDAVVVVAIHDPIRLVSLTEPCLVIPELVRRHLMEVFPVTYCNNGKKYFE